MTEDGYIPGLKESMNFTKCVSAIRYTERKMEERSEKDGGTKQKGSLTYDLY